MFMLNNSRNSKLTIVAAVVITVIAISTVAVAPFSAKAPASLAGANDFYQRHPDWTWAISGQVSVSPVTGGADLSDSFLRHPELRAPAATGFSAEQMQREYVLGERYGVTPQSEVRAKALREYWLGERYGQRP